jgi:asparagine synthase (glutamine-hydrolysing)
MLTALKTNSSETPKIVIQDNCGLGQISQISHVQQGGRKPLMIEHRLSGASSSRRVIIALEGELYNHTDIQNALRATRHEFQTNLDVETVARSYIQFSEDNFLKPFRGNYALTLWDSNQEKLILARDRLGRKPLYYAVTDNWLIFASKITAILAHPSVSAHLDITALNYLMQNGHPQSSKTLFAGIMPMLPGHMLVIDGNRVTSQQPYWAVPESIADLDERSETDIAADLLAHMRGATRTRLADSAVGGIYLSGTLESACLTSIAIQESPEPLRGFSMRFEDDPDYARSRSIRQLATYFVIDHTEIPVGALSPIKLNKLILQTDYPPHNLTAIQAYLLYESIGEAGSVILTDEGGDDLFASSLLRGAISNEESNSQMPSLEIAHRYLQSQRPLLNNAVNQMGIFYNPDNVDNHTILRDEKEPEGMLARLLDLHLRTTVIGTKLEMRDWYSQQDGRSIRAPYLDHQLIQYICGIPVAFREGIGHPSRILSSAFSHLLPPQVFRQQNKAPAPPIDSWLRGELGIFAQEVLEQDNHILAELVNMESVRQILAQHRDGKLQAGNIIWMILSVAIWLQQHVSSGH